jgi:hypothetical protein
MGSARRSTFAQLSRKRHVSASHRRRLRFAAVRASRATARPQSPVAAHAPVPVAADDAAFDGRDALAVVVKDCAGKVLTGKRLKVTWR